MTQGSHNDARKKIYAETRQDLLIRQLSNSEKYDNAILTLSTGVLGISLAFIKDIVPIDQAESVFLLKSSWWLFGTSIVSTLVSFVVSQFAIKRQLEYARKYYIDEKEEYLLKRNLPAQATEYINYTSGALFILGILLSVAFVSSNVKGGSSMAKEKQPISEGAVVPRLQKAPDHVERGAVVPTMQKVEVGGEKKGATIPAFQPVRQVPSTSQQSDSSQGSQAGSSSKKKP